MRKSFGILLTAALCIVLAVTGIGTIGAAEGSLTKIVFLRDVCSVAKVNSLIYENSFSDVNVEDEFSDIAQGALAAGIIDYSMLENKSLNPTAPVTREEAVTMVIRGLRKLKNELSVGSDLAFTDADTISPWALSFVEVAVSNGLIGSNGVFGAKDSIDAQEGAALIEKMTELYKTLPVTPGSGIMRREFPALEIPNGVTRPEAIGEEYSLVFNDDFEGTELDTTKWSYNYSWGPTHNHGGYCVPENVIVENGILKLKGENIKQPESEGKVAQFSGQSIPVNYTTGAVNTHHKWNFNYGYFEGSFKMPKGKGLWPAFWMLKDGWPPEIDMFEILCSKPRQVLTNYHYGPSWDNTGSFYQAHGDVGVDLTEDFHTYGYKWTPTSMSWYFDGKQLGKTYTDKSRISESDGMYIIINLAIDGWDGAPDTTTPWPAYFECDWVRVWQANE
ncbi:MAG: glycoside hydrolase family 16 protein [Clostridia bacterium]|nr:glycoside hydrolase family 16 protein [Clostridia bacterium]